jgi:hypothetical protein
MSLWGMFGKAVNWRDLRGSLGNAATRRCPQAPNTAARRVGLRYNAVSAAVAENNAGHSVGAGNRALGELPVEVDATGSQARPMSILCAGGSRCRLPAYDDPPRWRRRSAACTLAQS